MSPKALAAFVLIVACDGTTPGPRSPDAAAPEGGPRVTLTNTTAMGALAPLWVAFNDGDGPWQALPGPGPQYSFEARSGRYGLAFVCPGPGDGALGEVVHATVAELAALTVDCGRSFSITEQKLSGQITGAPPDATIVLEIADFRMDKPPGTASYEYPLPGGTYDFGAFAVVAGKATYAFLRRDLALTAPVVLDVAFQGPGGVALVEQPVKVQGADGAMLGGGVSLQTARTSFAMQAPIERGTYTALPTSALQPGETQTLEVMAADAPPATTFRGVLRGLRDPAPLDVSLPARFSSAQVTASAKGANLWPRVDFQPYPGALFYQLRVGQPNPGRFTDWLSIFSAAWLGDRTSYELPDFSAVAGFRKEYGFVPEWPLVGETEAVTSTRDFARTINDDRATRPGSVLTYSEQSFERPAPP